MAPGAVYLTSGGEDGEPSLTCEGDPAGEDRAFIHLPPPGIEDDHRGHVDLMPGEGVHRRASDRKSTRLNSSHQIISYAVFCLKKKTSDNNSTAARPLRHSRQ